MTDEERSLWCRIVEACGGICSDVTRERLEFEFEYDSATGRLHGDITGKFGSGVYRPRSSNAWISMEPDFEGYLETHQRQWSTNQTSYEEFLRTHARSAAALTDWLDQLPDSPTPAAQTRMLDENQYKWRIFWFFVGVKVLD